eukprot:758890-Ditylum_brightwellii.AAC.2
MDKMAKMATPSPPQDFPPSHKCKLQRLGALYKYLKTALGSAIQIPQDSAWERYTNTPRKCLGVLCKYTKKALGSDIEICHHHSSVCNPHTMRKTPMALYK